MVVSAVLPIAIGTAQQLKKGTLIREDHWFNLDFRGLKAEE
jgi:hypothetical protein